MKAKTGRQLILQSSARAACAFSSSPPESAQDKTTLQRVVMKRSERRPLEGGAPDFTAADHLICTILRQVGNFRRMYCAFHGVIQENQCPTKSVLVYVSSNRPVRHCQRLVGSWRGCNETQDQRPR